MLKPEQRAKLEAEGAAEARALFRLKPNEPGGFARAIDSIRHEVVERPWYGREVTGNIGTHTADVLKHEDNMRTFYGLDKQAETKAEPQGRDIHGNPVGTPERQQDAQESERKPPEAGLSPPGA